MTVRRRCSSTSLAMLVAPVVLVVLSFTMFGMRSGWVVAMFAAAIGYLLPGIVLSRKTEQRKRQIEDGLPDALDLLIVCVEAGCSLDQAIVKACRGTGCHVSGADARAPADHDRDPCRKASARSVQELRGAHQRGRRAVARVAARADRQVRHEHRAGVANACRSLANQASAARRGARGEGRGQAGLSPRVFPLSRRCTS